MVKYKIEKVSRDVRSGKSEILYLKTTRTYVKSRLCSVYTVRELRVR